MRERDIDNFINRAKKIMEKYPIEEIKKIICEEGQDKKIVKKADQLVSNLIQFDGKWDMEPCLKIYKWDSSQWNISPNNDPEWCYMLNRFEYLYTLILAYYYTHNSKYINKWKELVLKWIKSETKKMTNSYKIKVKINEKFGIAREINTVRSLDTAIRCIHILYGMIHLIYIKQISKDEIKIILNSLKKQTEYIMHKRGKFFITSNWGIIQSCSILIMQDWIKMNQKKSFSKILLKQLNSQILTNGEQLEASPMYHMEVFLYLCFFIQDFKSNGKEIDERILKKVYDMANYTYETLTPDNMQLNIGDSDKIDISDMMYLSCKILNNTKYSEKIFNKLDSFTLFYFPMVLKIKNKKNLTVLSIAKQYKDTKNILIKRNNDYLFIINNNYFGGHRHADNGHFILYSQGKRFLTDSGRYTYTEGNLRNEFKSENKHNTLIIDKEEMIIPINSWSFEKNIVNTESTLESFSDGNIAYISYNDAKKMINRIYIYINAGIFLIINYVRYPGEHYYKENFILDKDVKVEKEENYKLENDKKVLYIKFNKNCKVEVQDDKISEIYNEINLTKKIIKSGKFKDFLLNYTCFSKENVAMKDDNNNLYLILKENTYKVLISYYNDEIHIKIEKEKN